MVGFRWWGVRNDGIMYAMRPLRNFKTNQCCHLISRIANRAFFLNDEEKTRFVERLWRVATFSCVEVLEYCFMSNHFHILVYVPSAEAVGIKSPIHFSRYYMRPLMDKGMIERTDPDSPKSPRPQYKLA